MLRKEMLRNTALLTLVIFALNLYTPILMQPKQAEAGLPECAQCAWEWLSEAHTNGTITMVFAYLGAVAAGCTIGCVVSKLWKHNKCTAEGTKDCDATRFKCEVDQTPKGCGANKCVCKQAEHNELAVTTCTNDRCKHKGNEYRNCIEHTCESDITTGSYSRSYW